MGALVALVESGSTGRAQLVAWATMNATARACIPHLVDLGFTEIEAAAYTFLVQHAPATGYRVAHGIGKPVANTYKAIDSLRRKGAVMVDGARRCRAVLPGELIQALEERRRRRVEAATRALAALSPSDQDEGLYALASRAQTLERFRDMMARASEVALVDAFPESLQEVRGALEAAAKRGVRVAVLTYAAARIRNAEIVVHQNGDDLRRRWSGQWLNLAIDGRELLISYFGDGDSQAVWSRSPSLAWVYHGGLSSEILVSRLDAAMDRGATAAVLRRHLARLQAFQSVASPGDARRTSPSSAKNGSKHGSKHGSKNGRQPPRST